MIWATVAKELAGYGLTKLSEKLDGKPEFQTIQNVASALMVDPTPQDVSNALASDPDAVSKLQAHELALLQFDENSQNAARMFHSGSMAPFAVFVTLALMIGGIIAAIIYKGGDFTEDQWQALREFGLLIAGFFGGAVTFHVGSTAGSRRKTEIEASRK